MDPENTEVAVTVQFDEMRAPGGRVIINGGPIHIKTKRGKVTFTLEMKERMGPIPRFPSNPIQWVDNSTALNPIDPPAVAKVSRTDTSTTIEITASPGDQTYSFFIIVQTVDGMIGRFFGTDPTIVTMRPGDGGT